MVQLSSFVHQSAANKALHWMAIPLRSIATREFGRYPAYILIDTQLS